MFRLDLMPAQQGDCLWIEYGDPRNPSRLLVDGGTPSTYRTLKKRIESLPKNKRRFELVIISHIDLDHIGGMVELLKHPPAGLEIGDIWFNGFKHLPAQRASPTLSVRQAEDVTRELEKGLFPWNEAFAGGAIYVVNPKRPQQLSLPGGMKLTLLSPYLKQLENLRPKWAKEIERLEREKRGIRPIGLGPTLARLPDVATLADSPFKEDTAEANGSSIAVLAEYEKKEIVLGADAFASVMVQSLKSVLTKRRKAKLPLKAFKLSHHCSKANLSKDLLSIIDCSNYLISSNGNIHSHPDNEAIARLLRYGGTKKKLYFNYLSSQNKVWNSGRLQQRFGYTPVYGNGTDPLRLTIR
ncbi:MAG TPA: MBL fold metallo-hydrolase [Pyrinomonadaceae bacterium]